MNVRRYSITTSPRWLMPRLAGFAASGSPELHLVKGLGRHDFERQHRSLAADLRVTQLVNRHKGIHAEQMGQFDLVYAVNVKSIYWAAKHFVPYLRAQGSGSFINIASTAALRPRPGLVWYNGTKGAVVTISKGMAAELGPDNIRVNCINPVIGDTALLEQFMGMPDTPENRSRFLAGIPLGRFCTPKDVAAAALYLASDEAGTSALWYIVPGAALGLAVVGGGLGGRRVRHGGFSVPPWGTR